MPMPFKLNVRESFLSWLPARTTLKNPFGYLFMGFVYEEGHGQVAINLKKALYGYKKATHLGADATQDILRIKKFLQKAE